jgi:hypothetical protein
VPTPAPIQAPQPIVTPGGGQVGLSAPPPPPPPDPEPIVVTASTSSIEVTAAGAPRQVAATIDLAAMQDHAVVRFERLVDAAARRTVMAGPATMPATLRLLVIRHVIERALTMLPTRIVPGS